MAATTETLTLHLPASAVRRLRRVAEIAGRPLDEVVADTLNAGLPPMLEDVPHQYQSDLAQLERLPNEALRQVMYATASAEEVARYESLKAIRAERALTEPEQHELNQLNFQAERLMFRKAYAAVLLKWRGERVPSLAELEAQ